MMSWCMPQCTSPQQLSDWPKEFQEQFMGAWKAIESHDSAGLQQSISKMKEVAQGFLTPLDVLRVQRSRSGIIYPVTLLALCGFHRQMEMAELLLREGARIDAGCDSCGAPLSQMICHCLVQHKEADANMVKYFIEKGAPLSRQISTLEDDGQDGTSRLGWRVLDLSLTMCSGIEVAKVLVEIGRLDPINGSTPRSSQFDVAPMFQEYWHRGTNHYIRWLCNEYLSGDQRRQFVDRVVECITSMNQELQRWIYKRRTPSHAMLTCGHQETIKLLLQRDSDLLSEKNSTGKTALHMAAEDGDLESVKILLELEADVTAYDYSDMNPFMVAIEKNHLEVAKTILEKNPDCLGSQSAAKITDWALEKDLTSFFQCVGEVAPDRLVTPLPNMAGNTTVHLVAAAGNSEVFKIILKMFWNRKLVNTVVQSTNEEGKTALQLGVENGCFDILKVLQECIERPGLISTWEAELEAIWPSEVIPALFCHAASCGSLAAVKYFIDCGYKANISYEGKTPLLCAADGGRHKIVQYLLQFSAVSSNPENLKLPLLCAAAGGHTTSLSLVLQKTSVHHTDKDGKNCLMLAIENDHRPTALAILSDKEQGLAALRCVHTNRTPLRLLIKEMPGEIIHITLHANRTPLRLLIKEMPDLAEYVLNRCITRKCSGDQQPRDVTDSAEPGNTNQKQTPIIYNFQFLEDFTPASGDDQRPRDNGSVNCEGKEWIELEETDSGSPKEKDNATTHTPEYHLKYHSDNHILKWMVKYKRLKLLQHPLVEEFLYQRFWLVAIPFFLLYLLFYTSLLILLTSFALVSPRPGPDSETCPVQKPNTAINGTDCPGQSGAERAFLAVAAGIMIFLCISFLLLEAVQLFQRESKYFKEWHNYLQVISFGLIIVFVAPGFTNNCWCAQSWQWQLGAIALCLGWFNLIVLLKNMPCTAVPVNMFINICRTFLKLLFLPFLLLLAFAFPFYMVYARKASSFEGPDPPGELVAFSSPAHAIAKTMVQIVGEIDFEIIFNEGDLLYHPTTYILFVIFLITVPILFVNLLIGLAVGDTKEEKEKAEFTKLAVPVEFILERERNSNFLWKYCYKTEAEFTEEFDPDGQVYRGCLRFLARLFQHKFTRRVKVVKEVEKRNQAIFSDVMEVTAEVKKIVLVKKYVKALIAKVEALAQDQTEQEKRYLKALTEKVEALTEDQTAPEQPYTSI